VKKTGDEHEGQATCSSL